MSPEVKHVDDDFNVVEQGRILGARIVYCGIKIVIHVVYGPGLGRRSLIFKSFGVGGFWGEIIKMFKIGGFEKMFSNEGQQEQL